MCDWGHEVGGCSPSRGDSTGDSAENWRSRMGVWQAGGKGTRLRGGQEPHRQGLRRRTRESV